MDLHQGIYWEDEGGNKIRISDMTPRHAHNCTRWLERHAAKIADADSWNMLRAGWWIGGEQAALDFEAGLEQDERRKEADPIKWIQETSVWRALDRRAKDPETASEFLGVGRWEVS